MFFTYASVHIYRLQQILRARCGVIYRTKKAAP